MIKVGLSVTFEPKKIKFVKSAAVLPYPRVLNFFLCLLEKNFDSGETTKIYLEDPENPS